MHLTIFKCKFLLLTELQMVKTSFGVTVLLNMQLLGLGVLLF